MKEKVFYTNLFKYRPGIDDGDVLDTYKFPINEKDTAQTLHFKNTLSMKFLIDKNFNDLCDNNFVLKSQVSSVMPTYYPKRNESDSLIDWDDDIHSIEKLIRAVTKPFNGAFTFFNKEKVTIYNAQIFCINDYGYDDKVSGEILEVFNDSKILVKGYGGLLLVNEFHSQINLSVGNIFSNNNFNKKVFDRNKFGFHDI